jgi:hypothetical protein
VDVQLPCRRRADQRRQAIVRRRRRIDRQRPEGEAYNSPAVAALINAAKQSSAGAAVSIGNAQKAKDAGDHVAAATHLADAHAQIGAAQVATAQAAAHQPPPPPEIHPAVQQASHEVLQFTMNAAGQGVLTGVEGGIAPDTQVAIVQSSLAPTRTAPADTLAQAVAPSDTLPGGRGHNALIIGGICVALAGGVAIANLAGGKRASFRRAHR